MMTSTLNRHSDTWPNLCVGVLCAIVSSCFLSILVNIITDQHHVELTNCTIVDAHTVSGDGTWAIHVLYTIPSIFHLLPNSTTTSVLEGTNSNDHYFVNQTFPCYASTRRLQSVVLERQTPDGWVIAGIVLFSVMGLVSLLLLLSAVYDIAQYWRQVYESSKSKSVGGGSDDIESGFIDSYLTAVESDLVVDYGEAKDEDIPWTGLDEVWSKQLVAQPRVRHEEARLDMPM